MGTVHTGRRPTFLIVGAMRSGTTTLARALGSHPDVFMAPEKAVHFRSSNGWSPATVTRILDNEKYSGRWVRNRSESRRDPRTGHRRRFPKPVSEWIVRTEERLQLVPPGLWRAVRARRKGRSRKYGLAG